MKAADLTTAQTIVSELARIANERTLLSGKVDTIRARVVNSHSVNADKRDTDAIIRIMLAGLDRREGELRRRAAQIGLSL